MNRNFGNAKGPIPGPKGVIKQHHAMASGYEIPTPARRVNIHQKHGETGYTCAPGLTHSSHKR